jgi:hypothetical protein
MREISNNNSGFEETRTEGKPHACFEQRARPFNALTKLVSEVFRSKLALNKEHGPSTRSLREFAQGDVRARDGGGLKKWEH